MISIPGRIPILIYPVFWLLIVMIGWLNSNSLQGTAIWAIVIMVSVLFHEFGHALTALAFGQKVEINLVGLGGVTKRQGETLPRWKEFIIVLNGPLAGFLLCFLAYQLLPLVGSSKKLLIYGLDIAVKVNLFWTILNLVPVLPLDGGQLMRIIFEGVFGVRGIKAAYLLSVILATVIALYFFLIGQILVGALFVMMAFESYRAWAESKLFTSQDQDQNLQQLIREGIDHLRNGHLNEALENFIFVRQQAPKGMLYVTATQFAARILSEQGHFKKAYDWLYPLQNRLTIEYLELFQQLAYRLQEWEKCVQVGQQAYQTGPSLNTALLNAFSYAIMGDAKPAVGWLRCAVQNGLTNIPEIVQKREFDAIRDNEVFQQWLKSLDPL